MRQKLAALLLLLLVFPALSQAQKVLRVGTDYFFPPYVISGHPDYTGFDVEFMREVCKIIERKCVFKPMEFSALFPAITQGKIDVAIDAITITPTRQKQYLFSYPYMLSYGIFMVRMKSPIESYKDIPGKTVGVIDGTLFRHVVIEEYGNEVKIKGFNHIDNLVEALKNGTVDIVLIDVSAANYWRIHSAHQFRRVGDSLKVGFGLGIMTQRHNYQLVNKINKAIVQIENQGIFTKLYNRYLSL